MKVIGQDGEEAQLNIVPKYKHLGSADMCPDDEVKRRIALASVALGDMRRGVFTNRGVATSSKAALLDATVLQKLFYRSQVWTTFSKMALKKLKGFYHQAIRAAVSMQCNSEQHFTHAAALAAARAVPCVWQIRRRRPRHLQHIWKEGPSVLMQLLLNEDQHSQHSWLSKVQQDVAHMRLYANDALRRLPAIYGWLELAQFAGQHDKDWRRACEAVAKRVAIASDQEVFARKMRGLLELAGVVVVTPVGPAQQSSSALPCQQCGKVFETNQSLSLHRLKVHGEHAAVRAFTYTTHCVCLHG